MKHNHEQPQSNTGFIIWYAIIGILIITLGYMCFKLFILSPEWSELSKTKAEMTKELSAAQERNEELVTLKNKYENADENLRDVKEQTFSQLSTLEHMIQAGETDYKLLYLTVDDGPYKRTYDFLEFFDEHEIQATFFTTHVNGDYCYDDPDTPTAPIYKEYSKYGHTIANHTYTHAIFSGLYNSTESFMDAVRKQDELVMKLAGVKTNIVRFPGGSDSAGSLKNSMINSLTAEGYGWVDWTGSVGDGGASIPAEKKLHNFKKHLDQPIEVMLMHDYSKTTLEMLPEAIEYAEENNYIFAPLFYDSVMVNK